MYSGIGIVSANGSTGATTFARNYYGNYAKAKLGAPAVVSPALAAWNGVFSFVHAAYEALTDIERNEWIKAAANNYYRVNQLAEKKRYTGFHLFMHLNLPLSLIGSALLSSPPARVIYPQMKTFNGNIFSPLALTCSFITSFPCQVILYASTQLNAGRMSTNQIYTFMQYTSSGTGGQDLITNYIARFGIPVIGKKIFVRCDPVDVVTGVRGVPWYISGIVS